MRPRLVRLPAPPRRPPHEEKERIKKARELRQSEDRQASLYDKAVKYFHARRFDRALSYFQKSAEGPHPTLRHRAKIHIEICQRQKAAGKVVLKTADDHYNYGIKLINERRLEEAKRHLGRALKLQPKAGHIHFATAVLGALRGDREDSYQSLKRAIEIDPHNRFLALHDADLSGVLNDPSIAELLHEEGNARSST